MSKKSLHSDITAVDDVDWPVVLSFVPRSIPSNSDMSISMQDLRLFFGQGVYTEVGSGTSRLRGLPLLSNKTTQMKKKLTIEIRN